MPAAGTPEPFVVPDVAAWRTWLEARADGRWDRAYAGSATIEVPEDLAAALAARSGAADAFAGLDAANRYAVLHRVVTAAPGETRERTVARAVERIASGVLCHPRTS